MTLNIGSHKASKAIANPLFLFLSELSGKFIINKPHFTIKYKIFEKNVGIVTIIDPDGQEIVVEQAEWPYPRGVTKK